MGGVVTETHAQHVEFEACYVNAEVAGDGVAAYDRWIHESDDDFDGGDNESGPAPLTHPYYVFTTKEYDQEKRENRVWFDEDLPTLSRDVSAGRFFSEQSRTQLDLFYDSTSICWIYGQHGHC